MTNVLITSSVLIVAVLVLRRLFRKTLSRRAQYAVWALVLVRLLIPVDLPWADFSVLNAAQPVRQAVTQQANMHLFYSDPVEQMSPEKLLEHNIQVSEVPTAEDGAAMVLASPPEPGNAAGPRQAGYLVRDPDTGAVTLYGHMAVGPWELLGVIWKVGVALMAGFFLLSNARFWYKLRKNRTPYETDSACRVYLVGEGTLPSPCLFLGAIYLTPAAVETPERLRHVLAHEETHARHLDPLWSLLRCVCLSVYWFDPLVWAAALASRADCELACDEGVLERLGEGQRIPYGQTLLSLIPVRRGLENPLLSATTMTVGKRQLKDRVIRIAQKPRQVLAAVVTAAVLVAAVSACTFTGVSPSPADQGPTALTGEELSWFNESFFNSDAGDEDAELYGGGIYGGIYYTLRNQFANPMNLYDKPEDVDLYELFYCDGDVLTDEEYAALGLADAPCPYYKLTAQQIDDLLKKNIGLTLEQTNKVNFTYTYNETLEAYVWGHGDTNYCGVTFTAGEKEQTADGAIVRLYRQDWDQTWYCVTLSEQGEGKYWFVSHQTCDAPAIPTALPEGEPLAVISLENSEPCVPQRAAVELRTADDFVETLHRWDAWGRTVEFCRAADGKIYAAVAREDDARLVFLSGLTEDSRLSFYRDLFGHNGFYINWSGQYDDHSYGPMYSVYYFEEDSDIPVLLAQDAHYDDPTVLDLDGDGANELTCDRQLFYQKDGQIYRAQVDEQLLAACPELHFWVDCTWDRFERCCLATGISAWTEETGDYTWKRHIYFDGESLRVYRPEPLTVIDHMVEGADAGVPAEVIQAARDYIQSRLEPQDNGTWLLRDNEHGNGNYPIDDWRIVRSIPPNPGEYEGCEDWRCLYEFHTPQPGEVVWAGGLYVTEDGWVGPFTYRNR